MCTPTAEIQVVAAENVAVTADSLVIELADGRTVTAPLAWYPRLVEAQPEERGNWRLIGAGEGIHWPDLDEDISVRNVLLGAASDENLDSFKHWLQQRRAHRDTA